MKPSGSSDPAQDAPAQASESAILITGPGLQEADLLERPHGLTRAQVAERVAAGQVNQVTRSSSRSIWSILRTNLFNFFNNLLLVIGIALVAMGRYSDAFTNVGLAFINALIGTVQEVRAKRKLESISVTQRIPVLVVRDGTEVEIDAPEVVRGDVMVLSPGDQLQVDAIVVGGGALGIDESLLTGESETVWREPGEELRSGSLVAAAHGFARAVRVGDETYANQLTESTRKYTPTLTPMQRDVMIVVRAVTLMVALMSFAILFQAVLESFALSRVVQVSAVLSGQVPNGLFFLIALSYAVGAATLARQGALVQQTNAVESLAMVDTFCLDKTGTLTTNGQQLVEILPLQAGGSNDLPADPDRTEQVRRALGTLARSVPQQNHTARALADQLPGNNVTARSVPFDSRSKFSALELPETQPEPWRTLVLGAPEVLAPALDGASEGLLRQADLWADEGLRVLLLCSGAAPLPVSVAVLEVEVVNQPVENQPSEPAEPSKAALDAPQPSTSGQFSTEPADDLLEIDQLGPLQPLALVALRDELRPDALDTMRQIAEAGVKIKLISGDNPRTLLALTGDLGLREVLTGAELDEMGAAELTEAAERFDVFARVNPEHKALLVSRLRAAGHKVAMLGDGTNDALALKRADIGIAMQSGSPVTRKVADMVLLNDTFSALGPAMTEGRRIVDGLTKSLFLFIPRVMISMLVIVFVTMIGLGFPYAPAQVALTLFTVGVPSLAMTMWARPEPVRPHLLRRLAEFVLPAGIVTSIGATAIYAYFYELIAKTVEHRTIPVEAAAKWAKYTGVEAGAAGFTEAVATIVAQTAMSTFISLASFLLILFIEPPIKFFSGWAPVSPDKRPTILAAGLLVAYVVVLNIPVLASYFGLVTPRGPEWKIIGIALPIWFLLLRTIWRRRWFAKMLGFAD